MSSSPRSKSRSKSSKSKSRSKSKRPNILNRAYNKIKQTLSNKWIQRASVLVAAIVLLSVRYIPELMDRIERKKMYKLAMYLKENPDVYVPTELVEKVNFIKNINYVLTGNQNDFSKFKAVFSSEELDKHIKKLQTSAKSVKQVYMSCSANDPSCNQTKIANDTHYDSKIYDDMFKRFQTTFHPK